MSGNSSSVFPLVDRPSPILDRIRNDGTAYSTGEAVGQLIVTNVQTEDNQKQTQQAEDFMDGILDGMADKSQQPTASLNNDLPEELGFLLAELETTDIFTDEEELHTLNEFNPEEQAEDTDNRQPASNDELPSESGDNNNE